jgi:8-oxo-dGTP diphosphatase
MTHEVEAAGGVIVRNGAVLVVHRREYDDWSLPKGKLDPGETWEDAAVREVEEETGLCATITAPLGTTEYHDAKGRSKIVRYFLMEADGEPEGRNEVDEVRWVPVEYASGLLSYARDIDLLNSLR